MKRTLLSLMLALSMLLSLLPAVSAAGIPGEEKLPDDTGYGFTYAFVSPTTIEITAYYGYEAEVTVPSTIDGYTVVGIQSFHNEEGYSYPNIFVRKVVLPETVTYIADGAFYDSDDWAAKTHFELREIVLPQSLKTIGKNAFYHNYYLQKIDIPAGVTEIGAGAFAKCQNLSDITIRGENTFLHGGAFGEKTGYSVGPFSGKLRELHQQWLYDDSASDFFIWQGQLLDYRGTSKTPVIPDTVTVIGASAFWRSDITGVTIPSSVKLIGASAFDECASLTSVDIPGSVERIDDGAFSGCTGMTSITLHEGLKVIGDGGLRECESLTSLVLPEGLTTLEDTALYDCTGIESFTFPKSLTDMEDSSIYTSKWYEGLADGTELYCGSVFLGCKGKKYPSKLTVRPGTKMVRIEKDDMDGVNELILPDGLESLIITEGCGSITKLTVPESVNYINLRGLAHLTDLKLPTTAVLEESCFGGCYQIKNLTIPKGNTTLKGLSVGRTAHVVLPDDVLEVRGPISNGDPYRYNNKDCNSNLKSIDLKNVRILTGGALSDCVALESVTLPDSLITLGDGVFSGCAQLRSIKGGKNVRQIGDGCFGACTTLTDFGDLEKNVTRVGSGAFHNCGWFHDQPNGVVYFGKVAYAYKGTMPENTVLALKEGTVSVTYSFIAGQIELNPTFDFPTLAGLILPQSCKYVDGYAFSGAENMKFIDLGGVQYISNCAFNSSSCEAIVLPDSVRFVGDNAFSAAHLKAIHLNEGLRALDEGAFFSYGEGKGVTVPASVIYIGPQALGWSPVNPDDFLGGSKTIDGFVIRGTAGTAAQTYAVDNEIAFETAPCAAHKLVTETVAATCQTGGYTRETCIVCGYTNVTARTAPVAHKPVANDTIEATCTRPGYTGGTHCAFCGLTLTQPTQTAALGHDEVVATEEYEYSAYYGMIRHYCRRCELKWYDTEGGGHVHDYTYQTNFVYATCTTGGYTEHICACGDRYRDGITPALGHDFQWVTDKVATATEPGYKHEECTRCHESRNENTVIPATGEGHVHSYTDNVKDPTCTEGGYTVHTCTCGEQYTDSYTNALGHNYVNGVCTRCGATNGSGGKCDGGASCPSKPYYDVDTGGWYHEGVDYAIAHGLMNGVGSGRFDPNGSMTRAMLVTVLWRYAGSPVAGTNRFSDVPSGQWYTQAVAWAAQNGVVNGVGNGKFDPEGKITREQMAAILYRYASSVGVNTSARGDFSAFPDRGRVSGYAADALSWCVASQIIGGTQENGRVYLDPQGNATRAQVATILMRYISNIAK